MEDSGGSTSGLPVTFNDGRSAHQSLALIKKRGLRPWGLWDAQSQQDGTPHRHILAFEHDRTVTEADIRWLADANVPEDEKEQFLKDSEARVTRAARGVADAFWERFSSVAPEKRQEEMKRDDHGCAAFVVGDTDERYAPPKGKNGNDETAESIVKYMSRYSSRLATGMGDDLEKEYFILDDETPADDTERHGVWAKERNARLHNLIGIDTPRAAQRIWDCIYKAAERGEIIDDPRMNLAVEQMRTARELITKIPELRNETEVLETRVRQMKDALPGDLATMEMTAKASRDRLKALAKEATEHAYQAAIAMAFWPEQDLHASERLWLRDALELTDDAGIPLPPLPLRKERENAFGEAVTETVGIAAPVVVRNGDGECISVVRGRRSTDAVRVSPTAGSARKDVRGILISIFGRCADHQVGKTFPGNRIDDQRQRHGRSRIGPLSMSARTFQCLEASIEMRLIPSRNGLYFT